MAKSKKQKAVRKITVGKVDYFYTITNKTVTLRANRTAQGQNLIAGVLNRDTGQWHNDNAYPLPDQAKQVISKKFARV